MIHHMDEGIGWLVAALREDGGLEYKRAIVDAIVSLVRAIPDAREPGLGHLCEFIEDCEFTSLSTAVLHLLGAEGPATRDPERYVRHIYNRVILENAAVRAAAVSSLASRLFGGSDDEDDGGGAVLGGKLDDITVVVAVVGAV